MVLPAPPKCPQGLLAQVRFVDDADLAYVALRNRQVHDLWHVLFSCPTTVCGELGLKALEFVQVLPALTPCLPALTLIHACVCKWATVVLPRGVVEVQGAAWIQC